MQDIERASEALEAFAAYTRKVEQEYPADWVSLLLNSDGSGSIVDRTIDLDLLEFTSLGDLIAQIRGKML